MSRAEFAAKRAEQIEQPNERALVMARLYLEEGMTLAQIGQRYDLSRQRVHQILKPFGIKGHWGPRRKQERAQRLQDSYDRIARGESTTAEEVERLGYSQRTAYYQALHGLGLHLTNLRKVPDHGTRTRYRRGCRCEDCRRFIREDHRRLVERGPSKHGTDSSYRNYGCRCKACREAARVAVRERKARAHHKATLAE